MGIARFYRWLSERYPLINEQIIAEQIPEFDNLYLDMNGIIHNCSHNNTGGLCVNEEEEVFVNVFKYVTRLVRIIRPKRCLYLAVDGCAPRAKMNQQRSRRFRAANDALEERQKVEQIDGQIEGTQFDSNCITPGTEFMAKVTEHLQFFVCKQMQEEPMWQSLNVVVSGPDTPGEGEHKIMDYIRRAKMQDGYDPNTRHCLYGLDADLIMLSLASHEPHFALLREEVVFGRQQTSTVEQRMIMRPERFQLLHISLLREYLDLEFAPTADQRIPFLYSMERVIDDFILFCVLVGNDFLPHLPFAEISENGLDDLFSAYKEHLQKADTDSPWLVKSCGEVAFDQLQLFLQAYAKIEENKLQCSVDDETFVLGRRRLVGPANAEDPPDCKSGLPTEDVAPTAEEARVQYYSVKFEMDTDTHEGCQKQRHLFQSYLEGLHWVMFYYFRGPDEASWSWYYPYYFAPMVADLLHYDKLPSPGIRLDIGKPFEPFQQLMAVLPGHSRVLLPPCLQWLFGTSSPIRSFYPEKFEIDIDGVKVPWGGVTMIPWIDPKVLLEAMEEAIQRGPQFTEEEERRNKFAPPRIYRFDRTQSNLVVSSMPIKFGGLPNCPVSWREFSHPPLGPGQTFLNDVLPGCGLRSPGFPTLHRHRLSSDHGMGIKVFQYEARGKSLIIHLHPSGPPVPTLATMRELMLNPVVQIDYPVVHWGRVVAVHTANAKYTHVGETLPGNNSEHPWQVQELLRSWSQRGLVVDFGDAVTAGDVAAGKGRGKRSDGQEWKQPVAEVKVLDYSYVDKEGRPQFVYKSQPEYRLLHLVWADDTAPMPKRRTVEEEFPVGASVLCVDPESPCLGEVGVVDDNSDADALTATFRPGLKPEEQTKLQEEIQSIIKAQHARLAWHSISVVAQKAELDEGVVRQIFGSLMFRGAENVREDVGMNLICDSKGQELCTPNFSVKHGDQWVFSDLAVAALQDYRQKFPGLFNAIGTRKMKNRDVNASWCFTNGEDIDYAANKLVKYCNASPFKKLRLVPMPYMALTTHSIDAVVKAVEEALEIAESRTAQTERISGSEKLFRAIDSGSRPPADLMSSPLGYVPIGQRGIYVKAQGQVAFGSKGTVVAVYGKAPEQLLEVLLDDDSFGGSDLHGRCPPMRGLTTPATWFMPLSKGSRRGEGAERAQTPVPEDLPTAPRESRPSKAKSSRTKISSPVESLPVPPTTTLGAIRPEQTRVDGDHAAASHESPISAPPPTALGESRFWRSEDRAPLEPALPATSLTATLENGPPPTRMARAADRAPAASSSPTNPPAWEEKRQPRQHAVAPTSSQPTDADLGLPTGDRGTSFYSEASKELLKLIKGPDGANGAIGAAPSGKRKGKNGKNSGAQPASSSASGGAEAQAQASGKAAGRGGGAGRRGDAARTGAGNATAAPRRPEVDSQLQETWARVFDDLLDLGNYKPTRRQR
mmetsp:Transcript_47760/g.103964  ORF Transcript_47760/g.103964 Transcript_47760/m.103964 type:complete len:1448 (+) Transcript_47760:48-4391(+)